MAEPIAEYKCLNSATSFNDLSSASWKGSSEPNVPSNVAVKSLAAIESQLLNDRLFSLIELGDEFVECIGVGKLNVFDVKVDGPVTGTIYCCWLPVGQYISRTEGRWYDGEMEGLVEGGSAGVIGNEVLVTGKCTVGWEFDKCVSDGGARFTEKGIFSVSVLDWIDTEFVVWQLNQKKMFILYWFGIDLLCCDCCWRWCCLLM